MRAIISSKMNQYVLCVLSCIFFVVYLIACIALIVQKLFFPKQVQNNIVVSECFRCLLPVSMPEKYNKNDDFDIWLTKFEIYAANIPDKFKKSHLVALLDKETIESIYYLLKDPLTTYEDIKTNLMTIYNYESGSILIIDQLIELETRVQSKNESYFQYANALRNLAEKIGIMSECKEEKLIKRFMDGIYDPDVKKLVAKIFVNSSPTSFNSLLKVTYKTHVFLKGDDKIKIKIKQPSSSSSNSNQKNYKNSSSSLNHLSYRQPVQKNNSYQTNNHNDQYKNYNAINKQHFSYNSDSFNKK